MLNGQKTYLQATHDRAARFRFLGGSLRLELTDALPPDPFTCGGDADGDADGELDVPAA